MSANTQQETPSPRRGWDPHEANSFAPFINRTDADIWDMLATVGTWVARQGEYDQDDWAIVPWDMLSDTLHVVWVLWGAFQHGDLPETVGP